MEPNRAGVEDGKSGRHRRELIGALMLVGIIAMQVWGGLNRVSEPTVRASSHPASRIVTTWHPMHESERVQHVVRAERAHVQLDAQLQAISRQLSLPRTITVNFQSGVEGPSYDAERVAVDIPYTYMQEARDTLASAHPGRGYTSASRVVADAITFIVLHEVAHAIIDTRQLVVTGREEDAADVLATILALDYLDAPNIAIHGAQLFASYGALYGTPTMSQLMDEHLIDQQRSFGITCLVYGSHPRRYAGIMDAVTASAEQRSHCEYAYALAASSWAALLG